MVICWASMDLSFTTSCAATSIGRHALQHCDIYIVIGAACILRTFSKPGMGKPCCAVPLSDSETCSLVPMQHLLDICWQQNRGWKAESTESSCWCYRCSYTEEDLRDFHILLANDQEEEISVMPAASQEMFNCFCKAR